MLPNPVADVALTMPRACFLEKVVPHLFPLASSPAPAVQNCCLITSAC